MSKGSLPSPSLKQNRKWRSNELKQLRPIASRSKETRATLIREYDFGSTSVILIITGHTLSLAFGCIRSIFEQHLCLVSTPTVGVARYLDLRIPTSRELPDDRSRTQPQDQVPSLSIT